MSTLSLHAPASPKVWRLPQVAMSRAIEFALEIIDIFAEAQRQAKEAERKYPYAVW
jgi:hypothetical protein